MYPPNSPMRPYVTGVDSEGSKQQSDMPKITASQWWQTQGSLTPMRESSFCFKLSSASNPGVTLGMTQSSQSLSLPIPRMEAVISDEVGMGQPLLTLECFKLIQMMYYVAIRQDKCLDLNFSRYEQLFPFVHRKTTSTK